MGYFFGRAEEASRRIAEAWIEAESGRLPDLWRAEGMARSKPCEVGTCPELRGLQSDGGSSEK